MRGTDPEPSGIVWLLDVLHEVVHAHTGTDAACMFLPADETTDADAMTCPAMTPDLATALAAALEDAGVRPGEQREAARLLFPAVAGHEHAVVLPVVWEGRASGVLVVSAPVAPLGKAGSARVMELARNGMGLVATAADTRAELTRSRAEQAGMAAELNQTRTFSDLAERLVRARTTGEVVRALAAWLDAPVAVQLPNLIVIEADGPGARDLALVAERSAAEHEILNRVGGGTRVLKATAKLPARVVAPVADGDGGGAGFLLDGIGERGRDLTRRALDVSRDLIGYQMTVRQEIEASVATLRQRLLSDVLDGRPAEHLAIRAAKLGHDLSAEHIPFAIGLRTPPVTEAGKDRLLRVVEHAATNASSSAASSLISTVDDVVIAFVPEPVPAGAVALGRAIHVDSGAGGLEVVVGIGPSCSSVADLAGAATRARWAEQVLHDENVATLGPVAHIDDLGIYGLLFDHRRAGELHAFAVRRLGPLLDYDRKHRSELVGTLRELFRQRSLTGAATALHIHISTLKYRVSRIEAILGQSIEDWDNIFHLELAMRVLAVPQSRPESSAE
jgi:sugar diacid utilization regulator